MTSQPEKLLKKNAKGGRFQEKPTVGLWGDFASDSPLFYQGGSAVIVINDHLDAALEELDK